jgi:hypothetical protein
MRWDSVYIRGLSIIDNLVSIAMKAKAREGLYEEVNEFGSLSRVCKFDRALEGALHVSEELLEPSESTRNHQANV